MEPVLLTLIAIILSLVLYLVRSASKSNQYWAEKEVPHPKPILFLGNIAPLLFTKKNIFELHSDICKQFPNEPYVGIYECTRPVLIIKDADLIEKILIKDFTHFVDRGFPLNKKIVYDINLFSLRGKEWRALRYKLSPLFTSGKLKQMFGPMAECGETLSTLINTDTTKEIEVKDILGRFAMDVIGSCAFGIDAKNLSQPDSEFRRMGKKVFEFNIISFVKFLTLTLFPKIATLLQLSFTPRDVGNYFCKIIRETIDYRRKNGVFRDDFLQLLMILKEKGFIELQIKDPADDYLEMDSSYTVENIEVTEDIIIGQAFTFLTTGFEVTAAAINLTLYELAKNMEIQEQVRDEILKEIETSGSLTYDAIKHMTYLEQCVKETLRIYPPAPVLARECTKEYVLPKGLTISPGQPVLIPIRVVHLDPTHYPDPNEFRPERFAPDQKIHPGAYIPFGNGPRICIAMRFALLEIKFCLAKLLMKYRFEISPNSKPFKLSKTSIFTNSEHPVLFNVTRIATSGYF